MAARLSCPLGCSRLNSAMARHPVALRRPSDRRIREHDVHVEAKAAVTSGSVRPSLPSRGDGWLGSAQAGGEPHRGVACIRPTVERR